MFGVSNEITGLVFLEQVGPIHFSQPWVFWGIVVAAFLLLFVMLLEFVSLPMLPEERRRIRHMRFWLFLSRLLLITLVLAALAHPYVERTAEVQGNPRITILVDSSASTAEMDTAFSKGLAEILDRHITTTVRVVGTNLTSDVGSAILRNLEPGGNILLVSDGNINSGPQLSDVAFYATTLNATVSAINLSPAKNDNAIVVLGAGKVVADSDATFTVAVSATKPDVQPMVAIDVDGKRLLERQVVPGSFTFTQKFGKGSHRIEARLLDKDENSQNDVFWKEIHVLEKPRILYLTSKSGPEELLLRELYDVDKRATLPADLSSYYAIVVNDMGVEAMPNTRLLHDYLIDEQGQYYGNGIVFLGGMNSFDRGGYAASGLEPLLPVRVGKGERKKGEANLVFIVDVSGSAAGTKINVANGQMTNVTESSPTLDVIKAQVVNAIEQIKIDNKVSVIVFGVRAQANLGSAEATIASSVKTLAQLDYLYNNRKNILENVPRVTGGGLSAMDIALREGIQTLRSVQGDKNVILVTDGRLCAGFGSECSEAKQLMALAANGHKLYGVNFMTIGVGTTDEKLFPKKVDELFLKEFAKAGDGTYDRATKLNTLMIKWGDPKAKEFGQEFALVPLSLTHFITRDIEPNAVMNGFNQVVPKDTAELLIAADSGQPALTVWRYGNGRVATWTVFAGNNMGQLLNGDNSLLLSRTVNWAIADPQRKEPYSVDIPDTRINEEGTITVKSDTPVTSEALVFSKDGNVYVARFSPYATGFASLLNYEYAVNRPSELDLVGMNPALPVIAEATGGKVFKPSDSEEIIDFIKAVSKKVTVEQQSVAPLFIAAALLLFLVEIAVRRLTERRR